MPDAVALHCSRVEKSQCKELESASPSRQTGYVSARAGGVAPRANIAENTAKAGRCQRISYLPCDGGVAEQSFVRMTEAAAMPGGPAGGVSNRHPGWSDLFPRGQDSGCRPRYRWA